MDSTDNDWKKKVGFPINYDSAQSSDDDFDRNDVAMRHPRQSSRYLLADGGDGSEADLLGSTPPRSRIRDKEKRRTIIDTNTSLHRVIREKKDVVDYAIPEFNSPVNERLKKRASLKLIRAKERDLKQDAEQRDSKAHCDSLPSPNPVVPTLVESCNRFMSLRSTKCRGAGETEADRPLGQNENWRSVCPEQLPASRVNFHKTFSMLINMGNIEKGCRRTISREEQVWQNELKDLIWLEIKAKLSGRTLAQQDAYLCAQRGIVPTLIQNIFNYRFVNVNLCKNVGKYLKGSKDLPSEAVKGDTVDAVGEHFGGCLELECVQCSSAVGRGMREVSALLDSFYTAQSLYPSSKAMTNEHPLLATQLFKNRMKAMCLWFNTALNVRLKMLGVRRLLNSMRLKSEKSASGGTRRSSFGSDTSRQSAKVHRVSRVHFSANSTPTDSSGSDLSAQSDLREEDNDDNRAESANQQVTNEEHDSGPKTNRLGTSVLRTPEVIVSDSAYSSADAGSRESPAPATQSEGNWWTYDDVFELGDLSDLTHLRLFGKCDVSLYREHHREILKTQGVRRCMMFMYKMRKHILDKAFLTLEKPDVSQSIDFTEEDPAEVFEVHENKPDNCQDEASKRAQELRRFGCWSEECVSMRLPSYRSHFLLLSSVCMEAVHDYLAFRLESRPDHPSCLTVKQLMHELKEGLDIASEMRAEFIRHTRAAAAGDKPILPPDLTLLLKTFDATADAVLKQYLSYLRMMSETEQMGRGCLQTEWEFTARLAKRIRCAAILAPDTFSDIACNQLNRIRKIFEEKILLLLQTEESEQDVTRHGVYTVCRLTQGIYAEEREAVLQSAQWARALASRLARAPPPAYLQQRNRIFDSLMSIREFISKNVEGILMKSHVSTPEEIPKDINEGVFGRIRELLLQVFKLGFEIHKELHRFVNDGAMNRTLIDRSRHSSGAFGSHGSRARLLRTDSVLEDCETTTPHDKLFDSHFGDTQTQPSIELLLSGDESQVELRDSRASEVAVRSEEEQWAAKVARAVIQFAKCWMTFVVERCDRGRGTRPRWASQGLEFLMLACDPCNTKHLSEEEFEELKHLMDGCISHVIGSRPTAPRVPDSVGPALSPRPRHRLHSPLSNSSVVFGREVPTPPTPPSEPEPLLCFNNSENNLHRRRVLAAVQQVDSARESGLVQTRCVGRVLESVVSSYEPRLRQLTFKWQRGLKIGAGSFGKVYTVVNTESGQLLAMKELSIGAGDRRALQRAANELQVLEGIVHPHLVRYYGCELHREEMLLFMELCVEGSLEALVVTSGALPEHTTRRYTKQLVSALTALHQRAIAHRDVKSGNIFLTNEGHCLKLGDFGCAVKIRAHTTAPYELQGFVGTQAYMAPEVFMNAAGHGRAADIWSLGCVVTEMASGKRPFSEHDYSNYHIMFKVGMGERPHIPDTLSEEGQEFCLSCLTHDPEVRPRAETLALHTFLMVKSDESDCNCEPAYLMT